ncbi:MAG: 30S ribosomal protein S17 [Dehalococcoidia bacterium]|nr:30S ribosomal protein S17 [Dehalococcoidia bacterium]
MNYIGNRKVRTGQVVSDKMDKTVVVAVEVLRRHPLYKKTVKGTKKYKVCDEGNVCRVGDRVKIVETRPLSKEKRWRITEIISRRESTEAESVEIGKK